MIGQGRTVREREVHDIGRVGSAIAEDVHRFAPSAGRLSPATTNHMPTAAGEPSARLFMTNWRWISVRCVRLTVVVHVPSKNAMRSCGSRGTEGSFRRGGDAWAVDSEGSPINATTKPPTRSDIIRFGGHT
jgi:hypothetical protein